MTDEDILALVRAIDWTAVLMSLDAAIDGYNLTVEEQAEHDDLRAQIETLETAHIDGPVTPSSGATSSNLGEHSAGGEGDR